MVVKMKESCDGQCVHAGAVKVVSKKIPDDVRIGSMADFFKAFDDPTRLRILHALLASELCVCDLSAVLSMGQSAVSHQLKVLKMYNLVKSRREGKTVYYSLADDHVSEILTLGMEHIEELL